MRFLSFQKNLEKAGQKSRCSRSDAGPILESTYWVGKKLEHMERRHTETDTKTPKLSCSKINVPKTPTKKLGSIFAQSTTKIGFSTTHLVTDTEQINCKGKLAFDFYVL